MKPPIIIMALLLILLTACSDLLLINANANFIHTNRLDGNGMGYINRSASNTSNNIPYITSENITFNYHNRTR